MTDENKIPREMAEEEFERFITAHRIDLDTEGLDQNEVRETMTDRRNVIKAFMDGRLVLDDNCRPNFTPADSEHTYIFHPVTGAALLSMDRKKDTQSFGKQFAVLASLTKTTENRFSQMPYADLKICISLGNLFLA